MGFGEGNSKLKIAVIHDWFISIGGAEKVLMQILALYPNADVFCLLDHFNEDQRAKILTGRSTTKTYLQRFPFSRKKYRLMIPFFYKAIETLDLEKYDILISSSHAVAKGVRKRSGQVHFCYCHTPVRYAWDMKKTYLHQIPKIARRLVLFQLSKLKKWDLKTAKEVDFFIANSKFVAERIERNYHRESIIINPPVDFDYYHLPEPTEKSPETEPYFLVVSRLVHYKKVDLIIESFKNLPDKKLIVIGTGPQKELLRKLAGPNVKFLNYQPSEVVRKYMQHAEAMILAAIEDFGITSLETQACGTPVIAFNYGGYCETVAPNETGILFDEQTADSVKKGIETYLEKKSNFNRSAIRQHVEYFRNDRFKQEIDDFITRKLGTDGH